MERNYECVEIADDNLFIKCLDEANWLQTMKTAETDFDLRKFSKVDVIKNNIHATIHKSNVQIDYNNEVMVRINYAKDHLSNLEKEDVFLLDDGLRIPIMINGIVIDLPEDFLFYIANMDFENANVYLLSMAKNLSRNTKVLKLEHTK